MYVLIVTKPKTLSLTNNLLFKIHKNPFSHSNGDPPNNQAT